MTKLKEILQALKDGAYLVLREDTLDELYGLEEFYALDVKTALNLRQCSSKMEYVTWSSNFPVPEIEFKEHPQMGLFAYAKGESFSEYKTRKSLK